MGGGGSQLTGPNQNFGPLGNFDSSIRGMADKYNVGANLAGKAFGQGSTGQKVFQGIGYSFFAPHMIGSLFGGNKSYQPQLLNTQNMPLSQDMARQRTLARMYGNELDRDLTKGYGAAQALIPENAYGRLNEQPYAAKLQGYSAPEYQALRDTQTRENSRAYQTAQENLARSQAYSGVRGATASAQNERLGRDFNRSNIEANQNLMVQNIGEKNRALSALTDIQKYNQQKGQEELGARLGIQFGYGQLGSAQRAGAAQYFANKDALETQKQMFNIQQQNMANQPKGGK